MSIFHRPLLCVGELFSLIHLQIVAPLRRNCLHVVTFPYAKGPFSLIIFLVVTQHELDWCLTKSVTKKKKKNA